MKRLHLFVTPLLFLTGCTTTRVISAGEAASVAPVLSVERFLQASNARDLHGMANIFGTTDGPIIETGSAFGCMFKRIGSWIGLGDRCTTIQEVELRMDAISNLLQHDDYAVVSESRVAGREDPTTRVGVNFVIRGRTVQDVGFLVVQAGDGRWFVEVIELEKVGRG